MDDALMMSFDETIFSDSFRKVLCNVYLELLINTHDELEQVRTSENGHTYLNVTRTFHYRCVSGHLPFASSTPWSNEIVPKVIESIDKVVVTVVTVTVARKVEDKAIIPLDKYQ